MWGLGSKLHTGSTTASSHGDAGTLGVQGDDSVFVGSVQNAVADKAGDKQTQLPALALPRESCVPKAVSPPQRGPSLSHLTKETLRVARPCSTVFRVLDSWHMKFSYRLSPQKNRHMKIHTHKHNLINNFRSFTDPGKTRWLWLVDF